MMGSRSLFRSASCLSPTPPHPHQCVRVTVFKSFRRCQVLYQIGAFRTRFSFPPSRFPPPHALCLTLSFSFFRSRFKFHLFSEVCSEHLPFLNKCSIPVDIQYYRIIVSGIQHRGETFI